MSVGNGRQAAGVFVGRHRESARLQRFFGGDGGEALALVGPAGVGRKRVLLELALHHLPRVRTLVAGPDPSGMVGSWYPLLSLFEALLHLGPDPSFEALAGAAERRGLPQRDLPGLAELFGIGGPLTATEIAVRRREAHTAARRVLLGACAGRDSVLCFTDCDRYDHASSGFLSEQVPQLVQRGAKLLFTCEDEASLPAGVERLRVPPLDDDDVTALAGHLAGPQGVRPPPRERLVRFAGGLPEAVVQLVHWLADGGDGSALPADLPRLLELRLSSLSPVATQLLQAVALFGQIAELEAVEELVGAATRRVAEQLALRGWLEVGDGCASFPSPHLAAAVVAGLTAAERRSLLQRWLLRCSGRWATSLAMLGRHAAGAGEQQRAAELLLEAGDDAIHRFDDRGASRLYREAMAAARQLQLAGGADGAELFVVTALRLADVLRFTGEVGLAGGLLDEAELHAVSPPLRAEILRARGRIARTRGDLAGARERLWRALDSAPDAGFAFETAIDIAGVLGEERDGDVVQADLLRLLGVFEGSSRETQERAWLLALRLAQLTYDAGRLAAADELAAAALEAAGRSGAPQARGRVLALQARIAERAGRARECIALRAQAIDEMRRVGDRRSTVELLLAHAQALDQLPPLGQGEGEGAYREAQRLQSIAAAEELAAELGGEGIACATCC